MVVLQNTYLVISWFLFRFFSKKSIFSIQWFFSVLRHCAYVTVSRSARQNFAVTTVSSTAIPPITPDDNYKNNLNYGRVSAGCPNSHPDFDQNLGNSCSNQNLMGSVCSVGVGQEHFKIWLEYIFRFIL